MKVDAIGISLDKLTTPQDKSEASTYRGSAAKKVCANRATPMREAEAAKAQRQIDLETRSPAQAQQAQNAVAVSTSRDI
ncbi:hypothetical protein MKK63_20375 [Methylobacterium sp. J-088]|uniref:hypothetical protein n=1 Tax=Methylobacterium sp. J-088 TaxID=2836664 RepID=UPI001FBC094E|nr:hypothetical protein [Methylobacterium sp. J-088]MCJ2065048.1 hypothetical protein [Methylobacterium sp. J-088]